MERVKFGLTSGVTKLFGAIFCAVMPLVFAATAQAQPTNLAVTVRHAPSLNGNGRIEGSVQQLLGENVTLNGGFTLTGDLLVPGTPTLRVNGNPTFAGTIAGTGSTSPTGYQITLNGNCSLNHLRTRINPVSLPTVTAPPQPTGTRSVTINTASQSIGDPATLRNLTLNGNVGQVAVPPGTFGAFTVNGGSGLVLGVAGGLQAVNYNLQNLNLNGSSILKIIGPVVLTVANGFTANGTVGASNNPAWLQLQVASGGFTLNGGCTVGGLVLAPNGTVIINGNSTLVGTSASDQFILNGGGVVRWGGSSTQPNQPPVATPQSITLAENSSANITLTGSEPQGRTLTFSLLTLPAHGTVSSTPPSVTYKPATNYFGSDAFIFKVNNGITDSSPATVSLTVTQVYYPPTAFSQSLTNFEDTALPVTLTGHDPQGYALTFSVLTQPAHGTLSGTAPNLTYKPATNYFGNDSFTFRVNDGASNSLAATISITNRPVDDPPMVVAGPNQLIILPANSVNLAGAVAYDVFPGTVDTVVWSKVSGPGNVTFSNPSNTLTTATFSQSGIYRLRLFASDSFLSGSNDLFVTVDAPPAVNAGSTLTNTFPGTIILPGSASDDGLPTNGTLKVVWSKISGPGTVVFGNAAATNSTATFSTNGVYVLRLTADDGIATNHSDVTVMENLPPVVNAGTSLLTNGLQAVLNGSVADDGLPGAFLSAQWSQSSEPGTITFGDASATNTTVTASQSGTYVLTLTAFDGAAASSNEVVVTFNLPPVVNAGPDQMVNFGTTVTLAGTVTDDQLPHNILNSIWSEESGPGNATFADASLTNTTVTFDQPGTYILRLTASDGVSTNSSDISVIANTPPVVTVSADTLTPRLPQSAALVGNVSDDGLPSHTLTYAWSQISGPGTVSFSNPNATNTTASFSQPGVYTLRLTANDTAAAGSGGISLTVLAANRPPQAVGQSLETDEDTAVAVMLTGTDPDGDALTFSVVTPPAHGSLSGTAPNLNYLPSTNYNGSDSFTFLVSDGQTNSGPAVVSIVVRAVNDPPQLTVPPSQVIAVDMPLVFDTNRIISIADVDAGSGQLQLSLTISNGTVTLGATNGLIRVGGADSSSGLTVQGTLSDLNTAMNGLVYLSKTNFAGTDTLMLVVSDLGNSGAGGPLTDTKSVVINIVAPNNVTPVVSIMSPDDLSEYAAGQPIPISVNASDADGEVTNVLISADGSVLTEFTAPPFNFVWTDAPPGNHAITATATDNAGASSTSSSVTISVLEPQSGDFQVDAGPDQVIELCQSASLVGILEIQAPTEGNETNMTWSKTSGPGDVQFLDAGSLATSARFSEPGTYTLRLRVAYGGGTRSDTLIVTVLPPPPQRLVATRSSKGTDFWLTFLFNSSETDYGNFTSIIIAADSNTEVEVVSPGCVWDDSSPPRGINYIKILGGTIAVVPIKQTFSYWEIPFSDEITPNAIHITASAPVTVYGFCRESYSADGFLALPTAMLGTNYIVLSYCNSSAPNDPTVLYGGTEFGLVSPQDDTHVTITPTASAGSRTAGVPFDIVLQQGEAYRLGNQTETNADFTGTTIVSDKPVAVVGGSVLCLVPPGYWAADHLIEEMTPVNTWGRHFVTMPLATRLNGDTFRFLACANNTKVSVNGTVVATLNRGEFHERIIDGPAIILSTQPILVGQYANGTTYDNVTGDPFMMLVPPVEQFGGDYRLDALSLAGNRHYWEEPGTSGPDDPGAEYSSYLNLIVYGNGTNAVSLDGQLIPADQFQRIGDSDYFGAQLAVSNGNHHVSAPYPLGVCVYGWRYCESYGFMGGFYSDTVESDTQMALTQTTPFAAVGQEKTVTALVSNGQGVPVADIDVPFRVIGANPAVGRATTTRLGEAQFSYTGINAGVDVITATLGDTTESVTNSWMVLGANLPPVVSTTNTPPVQLGLTILLSGTATDDGQPLGAGLNVHWQLLDGPSDVVFENADQLETHVTCGEPGTYRFELTADDSQFSSRAVVAVRANFRPTIQFPWVEIPSLVSFGTPIELTARADDTDGTISRVEFYANDVLIGITTNNSDDLSGYNIITWTPPTNGWFQLRAVAYDDLGASNVSDIVTVQVSFPPLVSIDNISSGTVVSVPTNVLIHAAANDPDGTIVSLSIYVNGELFGTSTNGDLSVSWFPRRQGDYALNAVATDDLGLITTSDGVTVTVTGVFPQIAITNPLPQGFAFTTPTGKPILVAADASIVAPYTITNVVFHIWCGRDNLDVSVPQAPYQIEWTPHGGDDYRITAEADADSGAMGEAVLWVEAIPDVSVSFAEPAAGQTVFVGRPVPMRLSVIDPWHVLQGFNYYADGDFIAQTTNNDTVLWTPASPGNHNLWVQAFPITISAYISVTAVEPPAIENISIVSPNDGDSLYVGSPAPICLAFEDPTGDFDHAEIFTNGISLGQTTNSWFDWVPQQTNDYSLTAVAYDHQGNASAPSEPVLVHVLTPPPPVVVITSPKDGDRLALGQETFVAVDVDDPAQAVTNLELVVDGVKVMDSLDLYIPWTPNLIGSHQLTAVAADWNGNQITSAPVNVTVVIMHPPTVTVTSPADGIHFTAETLPPLGAAASDSDGIVTNLTLELDGAVLGETNGITLELSAANILGGWHSVLARATDNDGLNGVSTTVSFFIERSEDANLPVPAQLAAEALSATEIRLTWQPLPTNTAAASVLVERWNPDLSAWVEIGKVSTAETNYADANLNPETSYRYRAATTDDKIHRSAYSAEAQATTRTVVPNYSVIDLTEALIASLTGHGAGANILTNSGLNDFDSRRTVLLDASHAESVLGTNATALKLAVARFKEQWPQIQLDYDPVLLSPKSVLPRLGYLTGPGGAGVTVSDASAQMFDPDDPDRPVKAFLQEYRVLFGFGPEAITNATVQRDDVSAGNGARTVVWQQQVTGVPVFNALLIGHITQAGELACLSSEFIPSPDQAADPAMVAAVQSGADLPLSSPQALVAAVTNVGDRFVAGYVVAETDAMGATRQQTFTAPDGFKGDARAELTWFPASRTQLKLCWQVLFTSQWRDEMYLTLVTADTGEILYRRNLTAESSAITCRVYTNTSPMPLLPGLSAPGTAQPATVERSLVTLTALDDTASPNGWIADGDNETRGNNVDAHLDHNDDNLADLPRPAGNPSRVFDFPLDLTGAPANYGEAATVQLFYWDNWMHDALYELGFTEAAGNFQADNFGRGGLGNDAVQADAQDGLSLGDGNHFNNANMSTPPDGCAPRMQMYVFDGASPARDGSLDAQIVLHEYTHGLSTRLVGGGAGIDALATAGMGEGWSDFYALAMATDPAADVDGVYPMGSYVAYHGFGTTFEENYYYGIRRYPYCTDTNKNPLTFADIDPGKASAHDGVPRNPLLGPFRADLANEVHSQGEVWCMMLWEMRANLIHKLGPEAGNNLALQLVTDGLKLSPPNPNFVQARDAILLADRMWSGGTNAQEIWSAFAKRGLGFNAKAPESYTTSGAQESHDLMPALATERVEIQGGSGSVELGVNNNLLIHLRNQGDTPATHVSGQLATVIPGVTVLQNLSTYSDIPQGGSRVNDAVFQIQTGTGFVEGTPIDLAFVISSDQSVGTNYLRLFTGVPGAEILFDNYSAMADSISTVSATRDLTPWDIEKAEPLWMSDDVRCLLKLGTNRYALWTPDGTSYLIDNTNFLAHRLTRQGVVVGTLTATNTFDELSNQIPHSVGAYWFFPLNQPVPLTRDEYHWPANAAPLSPAGKAYSLTNLINGQPQFLTNVTIYPTLHDLWDINNNGVAVGSVSVQEPFSWQQILFGADGTMNWFKPSERGLDAGPGINSVTELRYYALLSSAAQFNNINDWRWLGPLSWGYSTAVALLVNDTGMVAGYGGVYTGNPTFDTLRPTHAFRAPASGEFDGTAVILTNDLGVLPGGLHSFPRAMNQAGDLVGYSDFDVMNTGGLTYDPLNSHAVFWGLTNESPEWLTNYPASYQAPYGYGDAFAINDQDQIVGASMQALGYPVGVLWQLNHNTNGVSSTTNAPFWEITDLNNRLTDPSWQVFRAVGINNDGLILADAQNAAGENHAVLLIQTAMAVDNNRDGKITFDSADQTTANTPYRFWINDDQDTDAGDVIPVTSEDCGNDQIKCIRDLEDFARLNISVQGFTNQIVQGKLLVGLKWKNTTNFPAIKLWKNKSPNGNMEYLTNTNVAQQHVGLHNPGYVSWLERYLIPTSFWQDVGLSATNPIAYLLFEGCSPGKGQLVLTINKPDGTEIAEAASVWLDLEEVSTMYEQAIVTDITTGTISDWTSTVTVKNPLPAKPDEDQNLIVMVHGIHVSLLDWDVEGDTVFKRLFWSGFQGKFATVKWPCELFNWSLLRTRTSIFNQSEIKAYKAGSAMKIYVDQLHARFPDYRLHLFVHSQGNAVVSEAIKQGAAADTYILTQGALPASAYDVDAPTVTILNTAEFAYGTPEWQPMGYRGVYTNFTGRIVNFYNQYDPVLDWWVKDQAAGKPNGYLENILNPLVAYYSYDGVNGWHNSTFSSYMVTDPQESRAMISRSLTLPVGQSGPESSHGVIQSAVDLHKHFNFSNTSFDDHSAQWAWPIQTTLPYYNQVLLQIKPLQ
jgi:hypothetical protein